MSAESRELVMFVDSDAQLYRQRGEPIRKNLEKKFQKGVYDHVQAVKLWKYLADDGAKKYAAEFDSAANWNRMFSVSDRNEAAQEMADMWLAEMELGNFMVAPKTVRKNNPANKKTGQIDASYTVTKMGMDTNGNHSVWVSFRGERAKKIQTLGNLPVTHRARELTPEAIDEISDFVHRRKNPAPFRGTTKPRRKSQITGLPPTKRLVKRRAKNTTPGYFPNPIKGEQYEGALHAAYNELSKAVNEKKNDITIQARVAYLEGIIDAGMYTEMLSSAQYQMWKRKAAEMVKARVR